MLPEEFKNRMISLMGGEQAGLLFSALENDEPVKAFRVNTAKLSVEDFLSVSDFDAKKIPYAPDGFYTDVDKPGSTPEHLSGMVYMQDPGAMSTCHALKIEKGWKVLDCCAAPGGKTTQLSAYVGEKGLVVANEYVTKRCRILDGNVQRMGCRNVVTLNLDTKYLSELYPDTFDLVLADAPCSGEGMFRKNSVAIDEWSPQNVIMCAERQTEILENVSSCVAPGGYLLYSTCTFSLEENEMNVDRFLSDHPDFELVPLEPEIARVTSPGICFDGCKHDLSLTGRFYPHVSLGEGQFIAVMKRASERSCLREALREKRSKRPEKLPTAVREQLDVARDFLENELDGSPEGELVLYNGSIYLKPPIRIPEFGVFSPGVCVGQTRKGRLLPHHHLFAAYGCSFKNKYDLSLNDPRLEQYLSGLEIPTANPSGWGCLTACGCPVGGIKISNGVCKNHFVRL